MGAWVTKTVVHTAPHDRELTSKRLSETVAAQTSHLNRRISLLKNTHTFLHVSTSGLVTLKQTNKQTQHKGHDAHFTQSAGFIPCNTNTQSWRLRQNNKGHDAHFTQSAGFITCTNTQSWRLRQNNKEIGTILVKTLELKKNVDCCDWGRRWNLSMANKKQRDSFQEVWILFQAKLNHLVNSQTSWTCCTNNCLETKLTVEK